MTLEEVDHQDPDLSDDEGQQPAFTGLFPPAVFKTLLFKASNVAQLDPLVAEEAPPPPQRPFNPLFLEPAKPVDSVPAPLLFLDVIQCQ